MTIGMKTRRFVAFIAAIALVVSTIAIPAGEAHAALNLQVASLQAQSKSVDDLSAQSVPDFNVFGADVSQWQGSVNWKRASSTLKFAIVRCGYGDNLRYQDDTRWLENAQKCRANGIPMGVYLYSYATNTTMAKSEANHVIRCLKEAGLNAKSLQLPIYLDMEDPSTLGLSAGEYANIFTTFKNRLVAHGYSNVGVYANLDWWGNRLYGVQLSSEMRWIAQWSNEPSDKNCGIWQYTDAVTVPGFAYPIDGDLARSDLPFLKSAPASPAAPKKNNNTKATPSVFALRNASTGDWVYTTDSDERAFLESAGWTYKGTVGKVPKKTSMPVYRFLSKSTNAHYFTASKSRCNKLRAKSKWVYEGVAFCSQLKNSGVPVYRYAKSGVYRCSKKTSLSGWAYKGIGWYATK